MGDSFYKYLPVTERDKSWGIYALNVGYGTVSGDSSYPSRPHPAAYHFDWKTGRTLNEYQLIYIAKGRGTFESTNCSRTEICGGSLILLFPGEWHRYQPDPAQGWQEFWIGFQGPIVDRLISAHFFTISSPILRIGYDEGILQAFDEIMQLAEEEHPGYQQGITGAAFHLLGRMSYFKSTAAHPALKDNPDYQMVREAKVFFRSHLHESLNLEELAEELSVSYSKFRKLFKLYTDMSPGQYFIDLKIARAKHLLASTDYPVHIVATMVGYESTYHFSKMFKKTTGISASDFRSSCRLRM